MSSEQPFEQTLFVSRKRAVPGQEVAPDLGHYLLIVEGHDVGKRFEIEAAPLTIGRDASQTVVLNDTEVSRRHARLSMVAGSLIVEDLGSTNGTFVDAGRLSSPVALPEGSLLRIGSHVFKYESRSRRDVERDEDLKRELRKATSYVHALLPAPLTKGSIRTDWRFQPSAQLGGDAFGYYWLDKDTFVFYLLDVSGHGVGAAMHSVTILNVLRQQALPGVDFRDPAQVLASLNNRFPMDEHGGMFFTMWYGVYDIPKRALRYGSAGHHPAFIVGADRKEAKPLGVPAFMLGALPGQTYSNQDTTLPVGCMIYLFSDGAFEIVTNSSERWTLNDFVPLLTMPSSTGEASAEADRVYRCVTGSAAPGGIEDDLSLVTLAFL